MFMDVDHYRLLEWAITPLDTVERRAQYRSGRFANADRVKDLEMRYRWDLLWMARGSVRAHDSLDPIFDAGYKDAHIDTALRKIVTPLMEGATCQPS